MYENVGVSQEKLVATSASIRESNSIMDSQLAKIVDAVDGLNKDWQSEASKSLKSIAANMGSRFMELHKEVETFAIWLDGAAANYKMQEASATETSAKIDSLFK